MLGPAVENLTRDLEIHGERKSFFWKLTIHWRVNVTLVNYDTDMIGSVEAVSRSEVLSFSKTICECIDLKVGFGVSNEPECGESSQKTSLSRVSKIVPVRLQSIEVIEQLRERGFRVSPGVMGEHITICGIDLIHLPAHTHLHIGSEVVLKLVARNRGTAGDDAECGHEASESSGLSSDDFLLGCSGVEGIVVRGGRICPGDLIEVELPHFDPEQVRRSAEV